MWGSGGALNLNRDIELFRLNPGPQTTSVGNVSSIAGSQFGALLNASLYIDIGSNFRISGFEGGSVDVDYPVDVSMTMPTDSSFEKGEWITIESDYSLRNAGFINSSFPSGGSTELVMRFGFATNVNAKVCVFGCTDIPLLPPNSTTALLGQWPAMEIPIFGLYHDKLTNTVSTVYPCLDPHPIPNICNSNVTPIPLDIPDLGLSGYVDLPQTTTSSSVNNKCITAYGRDEYVRMDIDILKYLSKIAGAIPGAQPLAVLMDNLSNNYSLPGGASVSYNVFSADFTIKNFNNQRFTYCPNVNTTLNFPTDVKYRIKNPSGVILSTGFDQTVTFHTGNDIDIKYPCNYEFVEVIPEYQIDETENSFRNETYDSLDFSFNMAALSFNITIPKITVTPELHFPEVCIPYIYPCPKWNKPWRMCSGQTCTPAFTVPAVYFGPYSIGFGPLWTASIPVGNIKIPWFDRSWPLKDMGEFTGSTIRLVPRKYEVLLAGTDILCKGDSTGNFTATIRNGTPPFFYEWSNNTTYSSSSRVETITGLAAGIHHVKVTDANGCSLFGSITLIEPEKKLHVIDIKKEDVSCYGQNDAKAFINIQGGTEPYNYLWSNGSTNDTLLNVIIGNYSLQVTDNNGCVLDTSVVINQPDSLTISTTTTDVLCYGDSTGTAQVQVLGGTFPYQYNWSTGDSLSYSNKLPDGTHVVTVTDYQGCNKAHNITINEPTAPLSIANITIQDVNCFGQPTGEIQVVTTGGTASYGYTWYNQNNIQLASKSASITNQPKGFYTVIITDSNGCKIDSTIEITEPLAPLSIVLAPDSASCYGASNGAIDLTVSGGTPPYIYNWSNGSTTEDLTNIPSGSYTITITDALGCTLTNSTDVLQPSDSLKILLTQQQHVLCYGDSTGKLEINAVGGTAPYLYSWSNGSSDSSNLNLVAGSYTITTTDFYGCSLSKGYSINQPNQPLSLTYTQKNVSCFEGSDGEINITVNGGTVPYTYQWADRDSNVLSYTSNTINNLPENTYTLKIVDSNNCLLDTNIHITQPQQKLSIILSPSDVLCFNGSDGFINSAVYGGTAPYTYNWSDGNTSANIANLPTGNYLLEVTDTLGCVSIDSAFIDQPSLPLRASSQTEHATCLGGTNGKISTSVTGGVSPYTYNWSNGETTQQIDSLVAGTYTVTVTDANGCTSISGGTVTEPLTSPNITYTVDPVSCFLGEDGHIRVDVTGGTTPYQLQWADSLFLLNVKGNDIYNLSTGEYEMIVTDANGCMSSALILVPQPDSLTLDLSKTDALCFGSEDGTVTTYVQGGTTPYQYLWKDSATTPNRTNIGANTYQVTVTDANGCEVTGAIKVEEPTAIWATTGKEEVSCREETDGSLTLSPQGGVGGYIINWSNGESTETIDNLATGTYTAIYEDANGCTDTAIFNLYGNDRVCIQLSNTITPNDDGINDTWIIDGIEHYPNVSVKIFNEWGREVFTSSGSYIAWDGTFNGKPLPGGTYYYIIDLKTGDPVFKGPLLIVR